MDDYRGVADDIVSMYQERKAFVKDLLAETKKDDAERTVEVAQMLKDFHNENEEIRAESRATVADLAKENKELIAEAQKEDKERASEAARMIADFAKENQDLRDETQGLVKDIAKENKDLIAGFKKESEERAAAWKEFLNIVTIR
ncbi:MAG: hypothetical protein SCARUB_00558 [Candidatus Scalindua rubra]|uniref:Uncharacterized protein n=1 Tax=Candidatus Scalindua rubra TaxID=1872076 RepID=A0A1E3XFD1_9BACT|nr:MAG: hypothetical protein SCARUB_00558 [Candidatus Scalindua rubra]